ncbi:CD82 antigen-like isoform X2 [Huso huso]|uniref:CD82 antigen-like isoform X2 n=1 Tax=Huso huso TaxID=61971 RepID=A0ABR0YJU3_HUSHU
MAFLARISGDFSSSAGSRVVVVTANSWSNDQSYVSVVQTNVDLFRGIIPSVAHYSPSAVLLITSQPEIGTDTMGKACLTVTKYFLFLFNLLFFIFGALILGFGLWILLDNQSFIAVLQKSSDSLKVGAYILISVGSLAMLMGFLGCMGAVYEIRCLLGLYFTCLLLILIAQVTAVVLIYLQRETLKKEMSSIITDLIVKYEGNSTTDIAWDYIQRNVGCCGWLGPANWAMNPVIKNSSMMLYPCSCGNGTADSDFCSSDTKDWPVHSEGCMANLQKWLYDNVGVILGICIAVAVIEMIGMILSMCLCKNVHQEDYTKVPKY